MSPPRGFTEVLHRASTARIRNPTLDHRRLRAVVSLRFSLRLLSAVHAWRSTCGVVEVPQRAADRLKNRGRGYLECAEPAVTERAEPVVELVSAVVAHLLGQLGEVRRDVVAGRPPRDSDEPVYVVVDLAGITRDARARSLTSRS